MVIRLNSFSAKCTTNLVVVEPSSSSAASSAQSSAPEQGGVNELTIGDDRYGSTSVEDVPRRSARHDTGGAAAADGAARRPPRQTNKATVPADSAKAVKKGNGSPPSRTSS